MNNEVIVRGDIYYADLGDAIGHEQYGVRPVIIIQNDIGNKYSPTVIVASLTSKLEKGNALPVHAKVSKKMTGIEKDSLVLLEQVRTIDKSRLESKIGQLSKRDMAGVNYALLVSVGLN